VTRRSGIAAAVIAALALPTLAWAVDDSATADIDKQKQVWQARFRQSRERVTAARSRHAAAVDAYKQMRHRRRDRGDEKAMILAELTASEVALMDAETSLKELFEEARRAGVPPGWMRMKRGQVPAAPEPSADAAVPTSGPARPD
jgi:hypothetical protein